MQKQIFETDTGLKITVELPDEWIDGDEKFRSYRIYIDPATDYSRSAFSFKHRSTYTEIEYETSTDGDSLYICRDGIHDEAPEM